MKDEKSKPTEVDPRLNELRGEAASLIRTYLWQSEKPPPRSMLSGDQRPWTMGRDLSMWNALVREGNDPETVNGAITLVRKMIRIQGPMTLQIFYGNGGKTRPIFEQCKTAWLKDTQKKPKHLSGILREIMSDG